MKPLNIKDKILQDGLTAMKSRVGVKIHSNNIECIADSFDYGNTLGIGLIATMLGVTEEEVRYKHPRDWWQAFKERWLPTAMRLGILSPVRYKHLTMSKGVIYPSIPTERWGECLPVPFLRKIEK